MSGGLSIERERAHEDEDEVHPRVWRLLARVGSERVGDLRYAPRGKTSFLIGVSVAYGWHRRGIATALLDEWAARNTKRTLVANVARENTKEGEALLRAFEASRGPLVRIDTGLDGD